ncbi:MAG: hypothetical protein H6628_00345 [Calditrichae bacterium]|nr:hypothetical protein [Calditrichia bacterium]
MKLTLWLIILLHSVMLHAQDGNITHDIAVIEQMLSRDTVEIALPRDIRFEGDAAKTAVLKRADGLFMRIKFKRAPQGGGGYNNEPRYEIAAYEFQKLFLDPEEYVVPPTAGRGVSLEWYSQFDDHVRPTFENTGVVYCAIQYWLSNVTNDHELDKARLASDSLYARRLGNLNLFTYLIKHSDSNVGNFLMSKDPANPRMFAVDNGLAFGDLMSNRGYEWRSLVLERYPRDTVERLRNLTQEDLVKQLSVVAQYRIDGGRLLPETPTECLEPADGVRREGNIVQFGLTEKEIRGIYERLQDLLKLVDGGKVEVF